MRRPLQSRRLSRRRPSRADQETISPRCRRGAVRLELLRHVHRHPSRSIRALAIALGRDYRRVHQDVEALAKAGLPDRDVRGLRADYETLKMEKEGSCCEFL